MANLTIRNTEVTTERGLTVGIEPEWKVEKQPAWLVAAIRKTLPRCQADTLKRRRFWTKPRIHSLTAFVLVATRSFNGLGNGAEGCWRKLHR
jgi:hypothetical protein